MRPAVLYAAKSTADPKGSIPNQLREGREQAAEEKRAVVAEFSEAKQSAYSGDRGPELLAARAEAERLIAQHGECALIIQHSDRLARGDGKKAAHLVEYALWGIKAGVKIISLQDPETFAHEDLIYAVLTGHRNHEDSRRKSGATKAGLRERREEGKWGGGPRPYGYTYDKATEMLRPLEAEVVVVRRIFDQFLAGASLSAIARGLEEDGVSTRKGRLWRSSTISQIIANPVYIGKMRHEDEVYDGTHEGVLDKKLWNRAQGMLKARRKNGAGRRPKSRHLLSGGLLRHSCGGTMICRSEDDVYICEAHHHRLSHCQVPKREAVLPRRVVDAAVYNYFEALGLDVDATRAQVAEARDQKLAELRALSGQAHKEKAQAQSRLDKVRRDYTDDRLTAEEWREFRDELQAELDAATSSLERLLDQQAEIEAWSGLRDVEQEALEMLADVRAAIEKGEGDERVDAVRAALARLFDGFELRPVAPGTRVHADLAWQPGSLAIFPIIREQAVEGYTSLRPIFRREPLYDAKKNQGMAHASRLRRKLDPEHGRFVINCWGIGYRLIEG